MKVVAATLTAREEPARDASATPTKAAPHAPTEWAQQPAEQMTQYNAWAAQRPPDSQRVRNWREAKK